MRFLTDADVCGERRMIASILNHAVADSVLVPKPAAPQFLKQYGKVALRADVIAACEARRFLDSKNELFCIYCSLLDIDPEYFSEKISIMIEMFDRGLITRNEMTSIKYLAKDENDTH